MAGEQAMLARHRMLWSLLGVLALAGCQRSTDPPAAVPRSDIEWFAGNVDAALAAAAAQHKPVFLYWGAVWCPPCNQIKKTIFTRREFAEKMKLFVPVYLDGDTERAQIWGDKLGASGYPTMIVYSPEGKEVARVPTGLQLEQFLEVLDESLDGLTPVSEIYARAVAGGKLEKRDWRLLAHHSWGQDEALNKDGEALEKAFRGFVRDIPADMVEECKEWRAKMVEAAAEGDEELLNKYLEEGDLTEAEIKRGLRARSIRNEIVLCMCGSAFKNKGVQAMLDAIIEFMPSPVEMPPVKGTLPDGSEGTRKASDDEKFSALAFKILNDPFVGNLTFFRVYSGTLSSGDQVYVPNRSRKERIGRLLQMHASEREEIKEVRAGDIAAAVGLKDVTTGDTLSDPDEIIVLEKMEFPDPVISVAVEPKTKADQEKMGIALQRLAKEDPSFRVSSDAESGQTIISGMGELHLEIIVDRMKREFKVEANVGKPQVAYRETIRSKVEQEGKFVRQSGGRGQYGHVYLRLEPLPPGKGYEFENAVIGGVVPKEYIGAVDKGIKEALANGVIAGYPMVDLKATLYDGSYHEVDSSEMAFKIAGSMALKNAAAIASPVLLEPIMNVEVVTPEDYMGDVMGDLNRRRGLIQGMEDTVTGKVIRAEVPLGEMFGYATDVRSMSQGRASYSMEFSKYAEAPSNIAEAIIKKQA